MKELKGELSGKLCTAVMAMGEPSDEYDATELRKVRTHFFSYALIICTCKLYD